jgi:hypothetical protein
MLGFIASGSFLMVRSITWGGGRTISGNSSPVAQQFEALTCDADKKCKLNARQLNTPQNLAPLGKVSVNSFWGEGV